MAENKVKNTHSLIVIGGSSGSLDALLVMLPLFPKHFTIPIIIVVHRNSNADSGLNALLASRTVLRVKEADEKERLQPGCIYLAPPDYHLLLEEDGTVSLDMSEKINYCRPSIDVTFTSAAIVYKSNMVAVLLSGANADGAAAMDTVKDYGGINIVQDTDDALVSYMPEQAILLSRVDSILPAAGIVMLLNKIAGERSG